MKSYVWLSFIFMGWGYYEISGGGEFTPAGPATPIFAEATQVSPEIVTRAASPTLIALSTSNTTQPVEGATPEAASLENVRFTDTNAQNGTETDQSAKFTDAETPETGVETQDIATDAPDASNQPDAIVDIRQVSGSRVNMRAGPSTDHQVITTLDGGTDLEVLETNAEGWARVMTVNDQYEGWMAERLLSPAQN